MKYLLTISYDGRRYCGYQVQKNGVSIQEMLGKAAQTVFGAPCSITGCSRTDSGVHARDFKATLEPPENGPNIPADKVAVAMNCHLPEDISVLSSCIVSAAFHPRYDVKAKTYTYLIHNAKTRDPFLAGRAYHYPRPLDEHAMDRAAAMLVGTHDFSAFMASGSDVVDTIRTIYSCRVIREGDLLSIEVNGNGFLYHMVRILVGTLISVSEGKLTCYDIPKIIASGNRSLAGFTAPACGLYLTHIFYDDVTKGGARKDGSQSEASVKRE